MNERTANQSKNKWWLRKSKENMEPQHIYRVFFVRNFRELYSTNAFAEQSAKRLLTRKVEVVSSEPSVTLSILARLAHRCAGPFAALITC